MASYCLYSDYLTILHFIILAVYPKVFVHVLRFMSNVIQHDSNVASRRTSVTLLICHLVTRWRCYLLVISLVYSHVYRMWNGYIYLTPQSPHSMFTLVWLHLLVCHIIILSNCFTVRLFYCQICRWYTLIDGRMIRRIVHLS